MRDARPAQVGHVAQQSTVELDARVKGIDFHGAIGAVLSLSNRAEADPQKQRDGAQQHGRCVGVDDDYRSGEFCYSYAPHM